MRLQRDTSGPYANAQDSLQSDLTTLQRTINQLQQQLRAQQGDIATLQAAAVPPPLTVGASGIVSGLPGIGMTSVVHDGSLSGLGTAKQPLRTVGGAAASLLYSLEQPIDSTFLTSLGTGVTLVPAVTGMIIVPLMLTVSLTKAAGAWSSSPNLYLGHNVLSKSAIYWLTSPLDIHLNTSTAFEGGSTNGYAGGAAYGVGFSTATNWLFANLPLTVFSNGTFTQGGGGAVAGILTGFYYFLPVL